MADLSLIFGNNCASTLAGSITSGATVLNLSAGGGAAFPSPSPGQTYFVLTIVDAATGLLNEIMHCLNRSGDTLTVSRGAEGTTPLNWNAGDLVQSLWTAGQAGALFQIAANPASIIHYNADVGAVNAYVIAAIPFIDELDNFQIFEFVPTAANTSSTVTLNVSGLGAMPVVRSDGSLLFPGDIWVAPYHALVSWNDAINKFMLINPATMRSEPNQTYSGQDTGTANNYILATPNPPIAGGALQLGQLVILKVANNNTGASTLQLTFVGGTTVTISITTTTGSALGAAALTAGGMFTMVFDGAAFQLQN